MPEPLHDWIAEYRLAIESGEVTVCQKTRKAYDNLVRDITTPGGRWTLDVEKGNRPIEFAERFCRHSKGEWAGQPVKLELWEKAFIMAVFGTVDRETGQRRFSEALLCVSRKNGKSLIAACILLYMLVGDGEPGAEIYTLATKQDQAKLIFTEAHNMVKQSPMLRKRIRKRQADLYFEGQMAIMKPLGRNSNSLDGLNAHAVCIDELHALTDRNLYEVMKQSMSARREPLLLMTTTAGTVRESIFDDTYEFAEKVLNGVIEYDKFFGVIYELDSVDEWKDEAMWYKANPSLGTVKKLETLRAEVNRARQNPVDLAGVLVKDFDMRGNAGGAWLTFDDIKNDATFSLDEFRNGWAIGGADLSMTTDLTCASMLMHRDGLFYVHQMFWIPEDNLEKKIKDDRVPYDKWLERGLVRLCRGNIIDDRDVTAWFLEMVDEMGITPAWIYYDPWCAGAWVSDMTSHGFPMVKCRQGTQTLSIPMERLGADLRAKKVIYNANPITRWCITNTHVETDSNGNIKPIKSRNPKQRIDGLAALLNCYVGLCDHYTEFCDL